MLVTILTIFLLGLLGLSFKVQKVEASGTIYIRADGRIDPSDAPITTVDNVTYTFTDNIFEEIVVERDNIVVDGAGYTVQGIGRGIGRGISLYGRSNVTIKNMEIKSFGCSIYLRDSSNTSISGNKITNNWCSIYLDSSSYNNIVGNNLTNNDDNIFLQSSQYTSISGNKITNNLAGIKAHYHSSYNSISNNHITNNWFVGISISYSSDNSISGNNITNNVYDGIDLWESSNNSIYHNNLINNTSQVITDSVNTWDKGYPSGGNYWSNYTGFDLDYDGIGDAWHEIDENNTDHYPLMGMFSSFNTSYDYAVNFISNSSISHFDFSLIDANQAALTFNVSGDTGTQGFCRVCVPKALINGSYIVKFNGEVITEPQVRELSCSNETHLYLYINYTHSEHTIIITGTTIIPEFPSFLILPLFMMLILLAVIVYRRKHTVRQI